MVSFFASFDLICLTIKFATTNAEGVRRYDSIYGKRSKRCGENNVKSDMIIHNSKLF